MVLIVVLAVVAAVLLIASATFVISRRRGAELAPAPVVEELPVSPAIARALLTGEGVLGEALQCARAYECAAWSLVRYRDVPAHLIRAAYVDALFWADQSRALLAA